MSPAQQSMYFGAFGDLRAKLKAEGWTSAQIDEERHHITRLALGRDKSSKRFTNADLDAVLAKIKARIAPADFEAQMRLQDSPEIARATIDQRIEAALDEIVEAPDPAFAGLRRGNYLDGTARKIFGKGVGSIDEHERVKLMGILERNAASKRRRRAEAEAARLQLSDNEPF